MKPTAVCFIVFVVGFHSLNAEETVADLDNHLKETTDNFVVEAESDPFSALQNVGIGLLRGMMIADNLVAAELITPEAAAEKMLMNVENGIYATLHIPTIEGYAKSVCAAKALPFSQDSLNMYLAFIIEMNRGLGIVCNNLGLTYGKQDE